MTDAMKSPYVYFGGKAKVAEAIWERFGQVDTYVEPFYGSGAVHLVNPNWEDCAETINDIDHYVANFWRAVKHDPDAVAFHADFPVSEIDLHARHIWLVNDGRASIEKCEFDPEYFDAKVAGWWVWGMANWIGSEFCAGTGRWGFAELRQARAAGHYNARLLEDTGGTGKGVKRQLPHLGGTGQGVQRTQNNINDMMHMFAARFERVRVCCGSWDRIMGPSVTWSGEIGTKQSICGVFLDPPYSTLAGRDKVYTRDDMDIAHQVRNWCIANGSNKLLRIALCGYDGEGHEALEAEGWTTLNWKTSGGYGSSQNRTRAANGDKKSRGEANRGREMIWFSPGCINEIQESLL